MITCSHRKGSWTHSNSLQRNWQVHIDTFSWLALRYFEELASRRQYLVVMGSGSMLLITLTAFIGNSLICLAILRNPRRRTATNYLITTLSATALTDATCTTLTRAFHKLLANFLATFRISSKLFRFEQILAQWAISSFLQILRYRSSSLSLSLSPPLSSFSFPLQGKAMEEPLGTRLCRQKWSKRCKRFQFFSL